MNSPWLGLTAAVFLLLLGFAAVELADVAWASVVGYRTPYAIEADLPGGPPLTSRLLLVILDGVRVDAVERMPHLTSLAATGASGVAQVGLPSLSSPGRATIVTGAWPEVHGVTNNAEWAPPPVESLFSVAVEAGVPIFAYGGGFWGRAFGSLLDGRWISFEKELHGQGELDFLVDWQRRTCDDMAPELARHERGLLVGALTAPDEAGHDYGGLSEEYLRVVEAADACLERLTAALDDGQTTYVITADHGHIDRRGAGGHGGSEPEVRRVPLVFAGRGISRAQGIEAEQIDIAPTVAALLGLPLPANSQGRILYEALELTPEQEESLRQRWAEQQELLAAKVPDRVEGVAAERSGRLLTALAAAVVFGATAAVSFAAARRRRRRLLLSAVVALGVYWLAFSAFGLGYSLSDIVREEYLDLFFARNMAAAALGCLAGAAAGGFRTPGAAAAVLVAFFGLRAAWAYFDSGLITRQYLPDFDQAFRAYLDLLALFAAAVVGAVVLLGRSAGIWIRRAVRPA